MLDVIEICASARPEASVIWLHGLGADGNDFVPVAEQLQLPVGTRFIFPNAPSMPVTINGGFVMPAWYDIFTPDIAAMQDASGIRKSQAGLVELIEHETARGIRPEKIVLAGFSQGGAIALQTALRYPEKLAGVLALSTYLPLEESLAAERSDANLSVPVFLAHGTFDTVIPPQVAVRSRSAMELIGYPVEWHEYPMAHSVCYEEIMDIGRFLSGVLAG